MTRLDNVQALTGNRLQYNYAITNADKDQIDTYFRDKKVEIVINYVDQKGVFVCNLTIPSTDF